MDTTSPTPLGKLGWTIGSATCMDGADEGKRLFQVIPGNCADHAMEVDRHNDYGRHPLAVTKGRNVSNAADIVGLLSTLSCHSLRSTIGRLLPFARGSYGATAVCR